MRVIDDILEGSKAITGWDKKTFDSRSFELKGASGHWRAIVRIGDRFIDSDSLDSPEEAMQNLFEKVKRYNEIVISNSESWLKKLVRTVLKVV